MFKHTISIVASATLVASLGADTLSLEPIIITSNAVVSNELQAPYAAEIYTAADIDKSNATTVYDFFATQSSLIVSPQYNNPFAQKIDMHGYGSDNGYQNIVITLDGRRLNNVDMTAQVLGSIPLSTIERIEILKGTGSVVYGDGANAGVINIITKKSGQNQITLFGGNYHTQSESLYLSRIQGPYSYSLHLDHYDTNGIRNINSQGTTDAQTSTNGGIALSYQPTQETQIYGSADFTRNNSFYGGTLTLAQYHSDPTQQGTADNGFGENSSAMMNQQYNSQAVMLGLKQALSKEFSLDAFISQEIKANSFVSTSFAGVYPNLTGTYITPYASDYLYKQLNANLQYHDEHLSSNLGLQGSIGSVDWSRGVHSKKNSKAVYLSNEYEISNHVLSFGGRYEKASYKYEDTLTPLTQMEQALYAYELGYALLLDGKQSLFAHYAHSFQFPDLDRITLADFTWPYTDPTVFNGFISPMKTDTYSLGYTKIDEKSKFKASLYYIDLKDEIYFYSNDLAWIATVNSNTNIDKSHKYGFDLNYLRSLSNMWNIAVNYNYVKAIIDEEKIDGKDFSGNELPGVSNHSAHATVSYLPNSNTTLSLSQVYRSEAYAQLDFENNFNQKQEAYHSTNLSFNYTSKDYELFAKINNLFDHTNGVWVRDDQIYPADFKRTITAGVKFIF